MSNARPSGRCFLPEYRYGKLPVQKETAKADILYMLFCKLHPKDLDESRGRVMYTLGEHFRSLQTKLPYFDKKLVVQLLNSDSKKDSYNRLKLIDNGVEKINFAEDD